MPADIKIDDFFKREALYIQNGFACGDWNDAGRGIIQLRPFNISENGEIDLSATKFVEVERDLQSYLLKVNDVIFNNTNSEELVGKTALWTKDQKAVLSNHMTIVRVLKEDLLSPQFVAFYLLKKWMDGYFHQVCRRHVNQASVSIERLKDTPFPDFEISEQHRIAHVLTRVQTAIEQQGRLIALTRELKSALMHKLFTEGLRGEKQKETEIGPVPESWDVVELERVSEKPQYGYTESAQDKGTAQFLRITDIQDFGVNWADVPYCECPENLIDKYLLKNGDLVFARIGATTGKSFVINNPPKAVFASYLIRIRPYSEKLDSGFLGFYCQTKQYWQQIDAHKGNNLKGGVNSGILQKLLVPLPKTDEQQEISQVFTALDNKINLAQKKVLVLEELFRTLLHQLMTGQIRV